MTDNVKHCNTGFATLNTTWIKQPRYSLSTNKISKEKFGAFSISAAVRGSCNRCYDNPWYRGGIPNVSGVS